MKCPCVGILENDRTLTANSLHSVGAGIYRAAAVARDVDYDILRVLILVLQALQRIMEQIDGIRSIDVGRRHIRLGIEIVRTGPVTEREGVKGDEHCIANTLIVREVSS